MSRIIRVFYFYCHLYKVHLIQFSYIEIKQVSRECVSYKAIRLVAEIVHYFYIRK